MKKPKEVFMIISGDDLLILLAGGLLYDRDMTLYGKPVYPKPQKIREIEISRANLEEFAKNLEFHMRLSYSNAVEAYKNTKAYKRIPCRQIFSSYYDRRR